MLEITIYFVILLHRSRLHNLILFYNQNRKTNECKNLAINSIAEALCIFFYWVIYFMDCCFPTFTHLQNNENFFVYLGCPDICILLTYIFLQMGGISQLMSGAKAGAIIGLLYGAAMNFFMYSSQTQIMETWSWIF